MLLCGWQELAIRVPWAADLSNERSEQVRNLEGAMQQINGLLDWAAHIAACEAAGHTHANRGNASRAVSAARLPTEESARTAAFGSARLLWAWSVVSTRACFMDVGAYSHQALVSEGSSEGPANKKGSVSGGCSASHLRRLMQGAGGAGDTSTLVPWLDMINHNCAGPTGCASASWCLAQQQVRRHQPFHHA